jgi:hypothetical protein
MSANGNSQSQAYNPATLPEAPMTSVTVRLTVQEIRTLKKRTGERDVAAALKAWVARANPKRSSAQLRAALAESRAQEAAGKGRRFRSAREAIRWLES